MIIKNCISTLVKTGLVIAAMLTVGQVFARPGSVTDERKLGFGYTMAVFEQPSASQFESIGYFEYLCHAGQKIAQVNVYAISPRGECVAYEDSLSGELLVFDTGGKNSGGKIRRLAAAAVSHVRTLAWGADGSLTATYEDGRVVKFPAKGM